jgi:VanZ family protein
MKSNFTKPIALVWWTMTLAWAALIFHLSTPTFGSDFTLGLLFWAFSTLRLHVSWHTLTLLDLLLRKLAHLVEYAIFALFLYGPPGEQGRILWRPRRAALCILGAAAYSLTDEFHQMFSPGRTASLRDCGLDTLGATIAMLVPYTMGHNAALGKLSWAIIASEIRKKTSQVNYGAIIPKLLGPACILVLGGILAAGLWPFHAPGNQVTWLAGGNGLRFDHHGTILSSGKFQAANLPAHAPCSFELWLVPDLTISSGTIFDFYTPGSSRRFSVHQSNADLLLQSGKRGGRYRTPVTRLYIGDILYQGKPSFITVTSKGGRVSVYVDGALARTSSRGFPLFSQDLVGELVIANSPKDQNNWSGLLRGLAFYDQALTPAQVFHHYVTWIENGRPDVSENDRAVGLYLFDERAGRVIRNQVPQGTNLYIPDRYVVLDQIFLCPFWDEFYPNWGYCADLLVNIAGFVPLGFFFYAYFSLVRRIKRPTLVTILLGLTVSLLIECLQAFIPTRYSGTTDLITNTLGTGLGVELYRLNLWQGLKRHLGR